MTHRLPTSLALQCLLLLCLGAAPPEGVSIEQGKPTVKEQVLDYKKPPRKLEKDEAAFCENQWSFSYEISYEIKTARKATSITVRGVKLILGHHSNVWLPKGASKVLRDHEYAHQRIAVLYYDRGRVAVEKVAREQVIGRTFTADAMGEAGEEAARKQVGALLDKGIRDVMNRSQYAQDKFDELTDHSRSKTVDFEQGMKQALAAEERDARK